MIIKVKKPSIVLLPHTGQGEQSRERVRFSKRGVTILLLENVHVGGRRMYRRGNAVPEFMNERDK